MLGKWRATHVILSSQEDAISSANLSFPITLFYNVRFLAVEGKNDVVIADRSYNQESYYKALRAKAMEQLQSSPASSVTSIGLPALEKIEWTASNPNVLTESFINGSSREIKVTKRSSESIPASKDDAGGSATGAGVLLSSSEYRRVTKVDNDRGIPTLTASRVLTKWSVPSNSFEVMEGMELIYSDAMLAGGGGDPLRGGGGIGGGESRPQVISKSRIRLQRIKEED